MNQAMQETNIIPGVRQRQVLNLHEWTSKHNKFGIRIEGSNNECWECRPRKKPLIGSSNKEREVSPMYQQFPRKRFLKFLQLKIYRVFQKDQDNQNISNTFNFRKKS